MWWQYGQTCIFRVTLALMSMWVGVGSKVEQGKTLMRVSRQLSDRMMVWASMVAVSTARRSGRARRWIPTRIQPLV